MGLRFRKSVNFGGFRVNFSKSGIGYSVGGPGFRYTVMPDGRERVTVSLPGTGISYVEESSKKSREISEHERAVNEGHFSEVKNKPIEQMKSGEYEEFISECQQYLDLDKFYTKGFKYSVIVLVCSLLLALLKVYPDITWVISLAFAFIAIYFIIRRRNLYNNRIRLEYSFDEEPNPYTITKELMSYLGKSSVLRCIEGITTGVRRRTNAGATQSLDLKPISITKKLPKLIKTNIDCFYIKFPQEELYVLPDKILLISNYKIAAINPTSLLIEYETTSFREYERVPSDARIIGHTWLYVNNNGSPDRRYNNNREIPICQCGELTIKSPSGLHIGLLGSNDNSIRQFYEKWCSLKKSDIEKTTKTSALPNIKYQAELSEAELHRRREMFSSLVQIQEKYDGLVSELAEQRENLEDLTETECKLFDVIISKGYVTENIASTFNIYDYNINLMSETEIQKAYADLQGRYIGIVNAYEDYQKECELQLSDKNELLKEYEKLVEDVRDDYRRRALDNDSIFSWCELCNEINLWAYWQGRGNLDVKILLVGQDWGCAFDEDFENFKSKIDDMNAGDTSVDYVEGTKYPTDLHLVELFDLLGFDLHKKNHELFFTNLILGYRKKGSTGNVPKELFTRDSEYLNRLVNIVKPDVIICLGKDTYEITASKLCKKKVNIDKFYQALDNGTNYTSFELSDKVVRIYAVAHCGSYGVMNRKMYATNVDDTENGLDLQKKDWMRIKAYLDEC